jgi:DNA (cytosine-5)-methyltransferase 1
MRGGTLFSGIGAPEQAMDWIDWRWCAEIEPFAGAVLAARHPHTRNLGDVTGVNWNGILATDPVDLIVFGSPCQSFSVAGRRLGLDDPRGNLALVALGIVRTLRPTWFVFENVPGLLSSGGGRDFGAFLGQVEDCGYGWAYRVLDAQHFGVPQRRRRLFLVGYRDPVGCAGDWRPAVAVLLEPEGLCRDSSPRGKARTEVARALTGSTGGCSAKEQQHTFVGADGRPLNALCYGGGNTAGHLDVATCLTRHGARQDFDTETFAVVGPLCSHSKEHGHAMTTQQAVEAGHIIAHALTAEHDASEDGTGRGTPLVPVVSSGRGWWDESQTAATLRSQDSVIKCDTLVPVGFSGKDSGADAIEDVSPTLRAGAHHGSHANGGNWPAVAYPLDLRNAGRDPDKRDAVNRQGVGVGGEGDPAPSCTRGPVPGVALAFQPRIGRSGRGQPSEVVPALAGASSGATSDSRPCVATRYAVRRLTPRECERLQGFPDDYTLVEFRGKPAADGPRYRALGNSMAVPVMRWIGERIAMVDGLLQKRTPAELAGAVEKEVG